MLIYDVQDLQRAVTSIHTLVLAPINIYDIYGRNISRPEEPWNTESICYTIWKECPLAAGKCEACYQDAFRQTMSTHETLYFKCHAGMTCVVTPIVKQDVTYGFIVLSEVTDNEFREEFENDVYNRCSKYHIPEKILRERLTAVPFVPSANMMAAMHLMEMAAQSFMFKDAMLFKNDSILEGLNQYIDQHMRRQIHIEELCQVFHISRTSLYALCKENYHTSVAQHIRNRRLSHAKELLRSTNMRVYEVAFELGFSQYSTFFTFFQKNTGMSPETYRRRYKNTDG